MTMPLLSLKTEQDLAQFVAKPSHAVLIIAPNGAGKGTVANYLAGQLLGIDAEKLSSSAFFKSLAAPTGKALSIEQIRDVTHFLMLKSTKQTGVTRVVVIEHAGDMTSQAQNALLKTIEEPPAGTVLILTASHELDVLATIRSRVQVLNLQLPTGNQLRDYFAHAGHKAAAIDKALLMSAGLPGLTQALLADDVSHPLIKATVSARDVLQKSSFERLTLIDDLTKNKQEWLDTLFIIERMAQINLEKPGASQASAVKWHRVLQTATEATTHTLASAQIKLVALNFILSL